MKGTSSISTCSVFNPCPSELVRKPSSGPCGAGASLDSEDRKSTRLNSSHSQISYAVFCLKKKNSELTTDAVARRAARGRGPRRSQRGRGHPRAGRDCVSGARSLPVSDRDVCCHGRHFLYP